MNRSIVTIEAPARHVLAAKLITEAEAAEIFRVGKATIVRWRKEKSIPHRKIGGRYLFSTGDIENFIEAAKQ